MSDYPHLGVKPIYPVPPPGRRPHGPHLAPLRLNSPPASGGPADPGSALPILGVDYHLIVRRSDLPMSPTTARALAAAADAIVRQMEQERADPPGWDDKTYQPVRPIRTFTTRVCYRFRGPRMPRPYAWDEDHQGTLTWRGFLAWALPHGLAAVLLVALAVAIVRCG